MEMVKLRCIAASPYPYNPGETLAKPRREAAALLATKAFDLIRGDGKRGDDLASLKGITAEAADMLVGAGFHTFKSIGRPNDSDRARLESLSLGDGIQGVIREFQEASSEHGLDRAVELMTDGDLAELGISEAQAAKLTAAGIATLADLRGVTEERLGKVGLAKTALEKVQKFLEAAES